MFIELAFVVCMISAEDRCKEEKILAIDGTLLSCITSAQPTLAAWSLQHSGWQIKEFQCRYTRSAESTL